MQKLAKSATEESTYVVTVVTKDETETGVTCKTFTWTLTDTDGSIINSREDVVVVPTSETVSIVLSGDDLALAGSAPAWRILTINATYDSDYGVDLPIKAACRFLIENLLTVS